MITDNDIIRFDSVPDGELNEFISVARLHKELAEILEWWQANCYDLQYDSLYLNLEYRFRFVIEHYKICRYCNKVLSNPEFELHTCTEKVYIEKLGKEDEGQ